MNTSEPSKEYWDGNASMPWVFDDGGRADAGYKGYAGDCVTRAVVIASGLPYADVYRQLADGNATQRLSKHTKRRRQRTARNGINVRRKWFRDFMRSIGFIWVPTMQIGSGCKVHLLLGALPPGRLVVAVSGHYCAVIDGVIHDTWNPTRASIVTTDGVQSIAHRCVYGYWLLEEPA